MISQPFIQNEEPLDGSINGYYENQVGSDSGFYTGVQYQNGYGLGGLLASFGCVNLPLLKSMAKVVGHEALKAVPGLGMEFLSGKPVVKALTNRVRPRGAKRVTWCYFQSDEETLGAEWQLHK